MDMVLTEAAGDITHVHSYLGWMNLVPEDLRVDYLRPAENGACQGARMVSSKKPVILRYEDGHILLSGEAGQVLNAGKARFAWIWAHCPPSGKTAAVLLPLDGECPSLKVIPENHIGLKKLPVASVRLLEHRLPDTHAICLPPDDVAMRTLQYQYLMSMALIGHSEKILDTTIRHTLSRNFMGQSLSAMQVVRHRLAGLHAALQLTRAYAETTREAWEDAAPDIARIKRTKRYIYQTSADLADKCLQLFGGLGYMAYNWTTQAFCDTLTYGIFIDEV